MNIEMQVSGQAAIEVQRTQRSGFRGVALLHDPLVRKLILFRSHDEGCELIAAAQAPDDDCELGVLELPGLVLKPGIEPAAAFAAAEAEIHRVVKRVVN